MGKANSYADELFDMMTQPSEIRDKFYGLYTNIYSTLDGYSEAGYNLYDDDTGAKLCLIPVSALVALELYKEGKRDVFLLYDDGSEGVAESLSDIVFHSEHDGVFGIEVRN